MNQGSQKIGLWPAVVVQTNAMIGAGVVATPAILAHTASFVGIFSYLITILITLCMAYSLGELSLLHGGQAWCYRFPHFYGKHRLGMISSFCYLFGVLVAMGFVAKQGGLWLHESIPVIPIPGLTVLSILFFSMLVHLGKNLSSLGQYAISAVIFLGLITISIICLMNFDFQVFIDRSEGDTSSLFSITPMLIFSFLGFECIASLYGIIQNPRKNVLKGGMIGVIAVGLLYVLFSGAVLGAIPAAAFLNGEERSIARLLQEHFPTYHFLGTLLYLGGLFAILGTLHAMIWSVSVLFMDVVSKSKSALVHRYIEQKWLTQKSALVLIFVVITLSSIFLKSNAILNLAVLLISTCYLLSIAALFKEKQHKLFNRLICIVGVLGAASMVLFSIYALLS